jgi:hypothetical protein
MPPDAAKWTGQEKLSPPLQHLPDMVKAGVEHGMSTEHDASRIAQVPLPPENPQPPIPPIPPPSPDPQPSPIDDPPDADIPVPGGPGTPPAGDPPEEPPLRMH